LTNVVAAATGSRFLFVGIFVEVTGRGEAGIGVESGLREAKKGLIAVSFGLRSEDGALITRIFLLPETNHATVLLGVRRLVSVRFFVGRSWRCRNCNFEACT